MYRQPLTITIAIFSILITPVSLADDRVSRVLLEPLISFFSSDISIPIIVFTMASAALALVFIFRSNTFLPLEKEIEIANKLFAKSTSPEIFFDFYLEVDRNLSGSKFLTHVWREYKETMTRHDRPDGTSVWQNTKRPQEYFSSTSILKQAGGMSSLDFWPSIFIGIGLLFTFMGLIAAIDTAGMAIGKSGGDVYGVMIAIEQMLSIASLKFSTSVAGIACSIGITWSSNSMQTKVSKNLSELHDRIERCLEFLSIEKLQRDTISAIGEMSKSISLGVAEGVQNIAGNELREFANSMGTISSSLSNSKTQIEDVGSTYRQELRNMETAFEDTTEKFSVHIQSWIEDLDKHLIQNTQQIAQTLSSFHTEVENVVSKNVEVSLDFSSDLKTTISAVTEEFSTTAHRLSTQLNEQAEKSTVALNQLSEVNDNFTNKIDKLAKLVEDLGQSATSDQEKVSNSIHNFSANIEEVKFVLQENSTHLKDISEKISDNQTDNSQLMLEESKLFKNAANDLTESISTLSSLVENVKNTDKTSSAIETEKTAVFSESIKSFKSSVDSLATIISEFELNADHRLGTLHQAVKEISDGINETTVAPPKNLITRFFRGR